MSGWEQLPDDSAAIQEIFAARARALARPLETALREETDRCVILALGVERYGIDVRFVQEIHAVGEITSIPGVPPFWAGLVNLRGRLYPVLDLRRYLIPHGAPDTPQTGGKIVLVAVSGVEVALLVDDAPTVRSIARAEIGPPLGETVISRRQVIAGITSDLLSVLDLEVLLKDPQLVVKEE